MKIRLLLADLGLHVGHVVATAQLIDDLWGDRPPVSAKPTLESYISRLRQVLNTSGANTTRPITSASGA